MAIFNGNKEFSKKRELSQPLVPVPKNVRQAFNIQKAYANGVFQLEPKRKETLYDRCYVFEDINYINKNRTEKKNFLSELMFWLNSMDASYKITLCNEYQSVKSFWHRSGMNAMRGNIQTLQKGSGSGRNRNWQMPTPRYGHCAI